MPGPDIAIVRDETRDFYRREYGFSYQERHLSAPAGAVDVGRMIHHAGEHHAGPGLDDPPHRTEIRGIHGDGHRGTLVGR
jgi:hypothetical protein